jgi:hypothetical protein
MPCVNWSPLFIFVSQNKVIGSGGGGKIYVLVLPVGGGFENPTGGNEKML